LKSLLRRKTMKKTSFVMYAVLALAGVGYLVNATDAKPKYLEKKVVMKTMVQWNRALGVKCGFCHTSNRTQTYETLAGRNVSEKELNALVRHRVSRAMLGLTMYLNEKGSENYTCNTCHQGKSLPEIKIRDR
jgi:hypothetical protein